MRRMHGTWFSIALACLLALTGVAGISQAAPKPPTVRIAVQFTTPYKACSSGPNSKVNLGLPGVLVQPMGEGVRVKRQLTDAQGRVYFDLPVGADVRFGVIYSSKDLEIRPGSTKGSKFTWVSAPYEVPRRQVTKSISITDHYPAALASLWIEARKAVVAAKTMSVTRLPRLIVVSELDQALRGRVGDIPTRFDADSLAVFIGSSGEFTRYLDNGPRKAEREWERNLIAHEIGHWLYEVNVPSDLEPGDLEIEPTHEWDKIYKDDPALALREGFAHAFSAAVADKTELRYGCGSMIDFEPEPVDIANVRGICEDPFQDFPTPRVTPCQDAQLSQYNELIGAALFRKAWEFLGEGDSAHGAWKSLTALRWFASRAGRSPASYRDFFDGVIQSDAVRLGATEEYDSSMNLGLFMEIFVLHGMAWGGRVDAELYYPDHPEYSGNPDTIVRLTGPGTTCSGDVALSDTVEIHGAYTTDLTGSIDEGPLAYTWLDDCVGQGREVRLPYSVPRTGVGGNPLWKVEVMYVCEDAGDEPEDRCKESMPIPVNVARDEIRPDYCGVEPTCTAFSTAMTDITMKRNEWVEVMRFDARGWCSMHMELELEASAGWLLYGCRT